MSVTTIKLSSKGQIVIPKEIRDELHWQAGTQLTLVSSKSSVTLKTAPKKTGSNH
jgi:AbrB family looped-hinge helix DNA binding protein